ncbi:MAG: ribosome biogenesis GTPase Der [Clostridiales bacterium]|nr:ribosome biogenesis GTPase Der [Clostridiales bacterium]MBO5334672.1 ribosome biogenesis GTPase Der [Clostridia bacterium]MBQ8352594.1 ribosome biogenesis GTPase Der [Clostridia bacterium]
MANPLIALVGRPNVGKSTFFNKVAGRKISITEDRPGVTRDRLYADAAWRGRSFTMVDTGGIELKSEDVMWKEIAKQAEVAIDTADVILFFTDGREGLHPSDYDVADILRRSKKPVILVVNKIDNYSPEKVFEFYSLGLGEPFAVSAEHSTGIGDVLDEAMVYFPDGEEEKIPSLKIAVVGKPNAGKSSLVNRLLGSERSIVTPMAGTTRDAIDTLFMRGDKAYTIIDTAGIRKKKNVDDDVEYYSNMRAFDAVRRSDVCLLVVDSEEGLTEQDVKIIGYVHEQGKPSVIVMNKWDLIEKDTHTVNRFEAQLQEDLKFMDYYKSIYISAKTGQRVEKILAAAEEVYANANFRISTGALNDLISDAVRMQEPPSYNGRRMRVYFSQQVGVCPPLFVLHVNSEDLLHFSYARYLENTIRKAYDFTGTPIKIVVREKKDEE